MFLKHGVEHFLRDVMLSLNIVLGDSFVTTSVMEQIK
jgi:hypothetical protein